MPTKRRSVAELMNPDVVCLPPEASVREAELTLVKRGVSGAPVVDARGRPIGVISQRDLARYLSERATAGASGRFYSDVEEYQEIADVRVDRSSTPVSELMSDEVYSVTRETGVAVAANIMRERRIHRLMVTDRGRLVGIVTSLDLLRIVEELG
ncbi:MAG TPA: CBS domain-containing protein [Myxococcota bacterium]|nr:CBS domain-containing protein [Myxococcota bacterium]